MTEHEEAQKASLLYLGDRIDQLTKRSSPWTSPQLWLAVVVQAVILVIALTRMDAAVRQLERDRELGRQQAEKEHGDINHRIDGLAEDVKRHLNGDDGKHEWVPPYRRKD